MTAVISNRVKCRLCSRFLSPFEIVKRVGICGRCLDRQLDRTAQAREYANFSDNYCFYCFDCKAPLPPGALAVRYWDNGASEYALICLKCSERRYERDPIFRDTDKPYQKLKHHG